MACSTCAGLIVASLARCLLSRRIPLSSISLTFCMIEYDVRNAPEFGSPPRVQPDNSKKLSQDSYPQHEALILTGDKRTVSSYGCICPRNTLTALERAPWQGLRPARQTSSAIRNDSADGMTRVITKLEPEYSARPRRVLRPIHLRKAFIYFRLVCPTVPQPCATSSFIPTSSFVSLRLAYLYIEFNPECSPSSLSSLCFRLLSCMQCPLLLLSLSPGPQRKWLTSSRVRILVPKSFLNARFLTPSH